MNSYLTDDFIKLFEKLPERIKYQARFAYKEWKENPFLPNLQFKKIHPMKPIYSVRINIGWRAIGYKNDNDMIWFWIGSQENYNKMISQL